MRHGTRGFAVWWVVLAVLLTGCASLPRDPGGTLERIRSTGILRVGASPSEGFVTVEGGTVTGPEADLATAFADSLGAAVEWHPGGEAELVAAMEDGRLDLIVAGLTDETPWADKVSLTRPWATSEGRRTKHVLAVPLGENATLVALETYLDSRTS